MTVRLLLKVEQRLRLNHRYLVRVSRESVDVQFSLSCLEVNIAERLQTLDFQTCEFDKHTPFSSKPLKVEMTLTIQIGTHLLNLKIGHIVHSSAQGAFMRPWTAKSKTLNQTSSWKHLPRRAYNFAQGHFARVHAYNMRAACNPDISFVFAGFYSPLGINLEKLRM